MKLLLVLSSVFLLSSCATVFRGDSEKISFSSNPSGAEVSLSTGQNCITPCSLIVTRKGPIDITYEMYGHKTFKSAMPATLDGGAVAGFTAFNFVMLPIINDVVDYNTRANYSRKPNPHHVEMIAVTTELEYPTNEAENAPDASQETPAVPDAPGDHAENDAKSAAIAAQR